MDCKDVSTQVGTGSPGFGEQTLFEVPIQEKAAEAETASPLLRLVVAPKDDKQV